jgi:hypothetical protein
MRIETSATPFAQSLRIGGEEFVLVPRAEYDRLLGGSIALSRTVDAVAFGRQSLGQSLRKAREHAGLTQVELARKLRRSQSLVSSAENGSVHVGERYVKAVLRACRLPQDWKAPVA